MTTHERRPRRAARRDRPQPIRARAQLRRRAARRRPDRHTRHDHDRRRPARRAARGHNPEHGARRGPRARTAAEAAEAVGAARPARADAASRPRRRADRPDSATRPATHGARSPAGSTPRSMRDRIPDPHVGIASDNEPEPGDPDRVLRVRLAVEITGDWVNPEVIAYTARHARRATVEQPASRSQRRRGSRADPPSKVAAAADGCAARRSGRFIP